jgi:hypothetical protein
VSRILWGHVSGQAVWPLADSPATTNVLRARPASVSRMDLSRFFTKRSAPAPGAFAHGAACQAGDCAAADCAAPSRKKPRQAQTTAPGRRFSCDECAKSFGTKGHCDRHVQAIHRDQKPFSCEVCRQRFQTKQHRDQHVRAVHRGDRPFNCEECKHCCSTKWNRDRHVLTVHRGVLSDNHLRTVHRGETRYECEDANCDYRSFYKYRVAAHFKSWHTAAAALRHKKAEAAVEKVLQEAGLGFDREARVAYGCGLDVGKHWASIDFVLHLPDRVLLLEVDEQQHNGYGVGCDAARMSHVHSALVADNPARAIVFVRFNPDAFRADGRLVTLPKKARHAALVGLLRRLSRERTQGAMAAGQLSVHYRHYDEDAAGRPLLLGDAEYPAALAACVARGAD